MGYERKRGKLARPERAAARRRDATRFSLIVGDTAALPACSYVITLDTDTQLPRDSARAAGRRMAHPLNRPRFDAARAAAWSRATASCSRASALSLPSANRSRYARLFGGEPGIDPYTRAVSDVYQDLFGEGSFIGKGIYDVDAFERALDGPLSREPHPQPRPARRLLRARRACSATSSCYEDYPSRYSADVEPPPPLDPRRLADRAAGCCRACRRAGGGAHAQSAVARCRSGRSSTTCAAAWCRRR